MFQIYSIAKQTLKAHLRSKILFVLIPVALLLSWILSSDSSGDGSLRSAYLVKLEYSMNSTVIICAILTLWLSTFNLASQELETQHIQTLLTKPIKVYHLWIGKLMGTVIISLSILFISFSYITWKIQSDYTKTLNLGVKESSKLTSWLYQQYPQGKIKSPELAQLANNHFILLSSLIGKKLSKTDFTDKDLQGINEDNIYSQLRKATDKLQQLMSLKTQLMTSRVHYDAIPSFKQKTAEQIFSERVKQGMAQEKLKATMLPLIKDEIRRSEGRIASNDSKVWLFENLPRDQKNNIFLKMRFFYGLNLASLSKTGQLNILISMWDPETKQWSNPYPWQGRGARFHYLPIKSKFIDKNGSAKIRIHNQSGKKDAVNALLIQRGDGPFIVMGESSFLKSMSQNLFLFSGLLFTFTAVGCSAGMIFTSSMAILVAVFYFLVGSLLGSFTDTVPPEPVLEKILYFFHYGVSLLIAGFDDFHRSEFIARGQILTPLMAIIIWLKEVILQLLFLLISTHFITQRKEFGKAK